MANASKEVVIHHFPHFPRPHRPHGDNLILAGLAVVGFGLAGVTLGVSKDAIDRTQPRIDSLPRPGVVEPEVMRFPIGEYLNLTLGSAGEVVMEFTKEPKPLKAISFNATSFEIDEGGLIYFRHADPNKSQSFGVFVDSLKDNSFVPVFGNGDKDFPLASDNIPHGDIWLIRRNGDGENLGPDGQILPPGELPILTRIDWVNLAIPFQLPE